MNRLQAKALSSELNASIEAILKKHGLDTPKMNIKFTPEGDVSFSVTTSTELSRLNTVALYASHHGFTKDQLRKSFSLSGKTLRVFNYNTRAPKMPWVCEDSNGARYKLTTEQLTQVLKR